MVVRHGLSHMSWTYDRLSLPRPRPSWNKQHLPAQHRLTICQVNHIANLILPNQLRLYSTSTLERHHLNQALVILNLDGNQILKNLNEEEYSATLAVVEEAILATDLSLHFKHLGALKALAAKVTIMKKEFLSCFCVKSY